LKAGEGVAGWVAQQGATAAIAEGAAGDDRRAGAAALPEDELAALLSTPIFAGGEVAGVLNVHHSAAHQHTAEEMEAAAFIAGQAGMALAQAQAAAAGSRLDALAEMARAVAREGHVDRALQAVVEKAAAVFDAPLAAALLLDEESRELRAAAVFRLSPSFAHNDVVGLEETMSGRVLREGKAVRVASHVKGQQRAAPEAAASADVAALLAVPIATRGKPCGTLNVYSREARQFADGDVQFLQAVAHLAGLALAYATLSAECDELKHNLETRKVVERAKGILQQKHQLTEEEAYLRLRNESRRLRRPMKDLAEAVILAEDLSRKGKAESGV
jgi:uroporphyrinogen-III synthase